MTISSEIVIAAIGAIATGFGAVLRVVYRDLRADRDMWRQQAMELAKHSGKAIEVAEKVVGA